MAHVHGFGRDDVLRRVHPNYLGSAFARAARRHHFVWKLTAVSDVLLGILLGVAGIEILYMIDMRRRGARVKPYSVFVIFLIALVGEVGAYIHTGPIAQVSFAIVFGLAALLTHLNREHWLGKD